MGESSACLFRSFSQPTPSSPKEEDPICRALTSSVSFGRFVSESLAWDRWSAFNQNRYLEEAERYSKPGSVAEKKAYFEAHYKNIAAKRAAALLEQQCPEVVTSPVENNANEKENNPAAAMDLAEESSFEHTANAKIHVEENSLCTDVILAVDTQPQRLPHESSMETEEVENRPNADMLLTVDTAHQRLPQELKMETEGVEENRPDADELLLVDKYRQSLPQELNMDPEREEENRLNADVLLSVDTDHQRQPQESNMEAEVVGEQAIGHPLSVDGNDQVVAKVREEKAMKTTIEAPSTSGEDFASLEKNEATLPSGKPSSSDHGSKFRSFVKPSNPVCPKKRGNTGNHVGKKTSNQPIPQAVHMSINLTSRTLRNISKSPAVSRKIVDSITHKPVARTSYERSSKPQPHIRASASDMPVPPKLESGRTETLMCQSVSGSISRGEKFNSLLLNGNRKQTCRSKMKSPTTISSSFSLRSEERAAKRKEFFQRLEEKLNGEAENQTKQEIKANGFSNTAWKSVSSQHDTKANIHHSTKLANIATKKVSTQSFTSKMGKKVASEAQDTNCKPPWRFSMKKTDSFIRDAVEKNYNKATPNKTRTNENTSPNIQLQVSKRCLKMDTSRRQ